MAIGYQHKNANIDPKLAKTSKTNKVTPELKGQEATANKQSWM